MGINSVGFLLFFCVVFILYWHVCGNSSRRQNVCLLLASYVFYGIVEWRMLPLLLAATLCFYALGLTVEKCIHQGKDRRASVLTTVGVLLGIGALLYFKYFNFFIESFRSLFESLGLHTNLHTFFIIMPLGISFFTFKLISYLIEVHRCHIPATRDCVSFATYVAFFPTIMAGPIDRPKAFLSQLSKKRAFDYPMAVDGLRQILWGMLKKMVIADNLGNLTAAVWAGHENYAGSLLLLSALLYAFQMYADFSGYSDMAIGVGKLLGLRVAVNFNYPFFATNVAEYWRRWHMSLTSWLTDYIFMPLNIRFRDWGRSGMALAVIINLVAVGMWHGSNYTFAVFGLYHGLLFIPLICSGAFQKKTKLRLTTSRLPLGKDVLKMIGTYLLVSLGLVVFSAPSLGNAAIYLSHLLTAFSINPFSDFLSLDIPKMRLALACLLSVVVVCLEWRAFVRKKEYAFQLIEGFPLGVRYTVYLLMFFLCIWWNGEAREFMYVQF